MERAWLGAAVTVQAQGEAGHLSSYEDRRNALEFCQGLISPRSLSAWRARRCSDKALPIPGCVCWPSRAQSGPLDGGSHGTLRVSQRAQRDAVSTRRSWVCSGLHSGGNEMEEPRFPCRGHHLPAPWYLPGCSLHPPW